MRPFLKVKCLFLVDTFSAFLCVIPSGAQRNRGIYAIARIIAVTIVPRFFDFGYAFAQNDTVVRYCNFRGVESPPPTMFYRGGLPRPVGVRNDRCFDGDCHSTSCFAMTQILE